MNIIFLFLVLNCYTDNAYSKSGFIKIVYMTIMKH